MKTKILSLVLAVVMAVSALSLVSCQEKKTTYEIVSEAISNTLALDMVNITIDEKVKQTVEGESQTQNSEMAILMKGFNTDNPEYSTDFKISSSGVTIDMGIYFKDNYFYVDAMGSKGKTEKGIETESYDIHQIVKKILCQIPEDQFADKTLEEGKIEFIIPADVFEKTFEGFTKLSTAAIENAATVKSKTFENCKVVIEVKDGYVSSYSISYELDLVAKVQGQEYTFAIEATDNLKVNEPGKEVSVKVPSNLGEYEE